MNIATTGCELKICILSAFAKGKGHEQGGDRVKSKIQPHHL